MPDSIAAVLKIIHFENDTWKLTLPLILMGVDILTGLIKAWVNKNFQSTKMRSGLGKKVGEITILALGIAFSTALCLPAYLMTAASIYIVFMELMSIFENLKQLRVPIPKFIDAALASIDHVVNEEADIRNIANGIEDLQKDLSKEDNKNEENAHE